MHKALLQDEEALRQNHLDASGKCLQAKINAQTWPKSHENVTKRIVHPGQVSDVHACVLHPEFMTFLKHFAEGPQSLLSLLMGSFAM